MKKNTILSPLIWGNMRILDNPDFHNAQNLADFLSWLMDNGITSFDSADIYGGFRVEAHFGKALSLLAQKRDDFQLISKASIQLISDIRPENQVKHYNSSASYLRSSVDKILQNLNIDYLDVFLLHRPDYLMNAEETAFGLDALQAEGKVKHIGVSNYTNSQIDLLQSFLKTPIMTNQIEFSPCHLSPIFDGSFDKAQQMNMAPMIYSPFAAGRVFSGEHNQNLVTTLHHIALKYNINIEATVLAWIRRMPCYPMPIIGSNKKENIAKSLEADNIHLDIQDWYKILEAAQGAEVP